MAKAMRHYKCPKCSEPFKAKLRKGVPTRGCPGCGWLPPESKKGLDKTATAQA